MRLDKLFLIAIIVVICLGFIFTVFFIMYVIGFILNPHSYVGLLTRGYIL